MNLVKADFYQIVHKKAFWGVLVLVTLMAGIYVGTSYGVESGAMGKNAIGTASGLMDVMIMNIVGPIMAAVFVCRDFQNKTIHDMVLQNGRKKIVWAKMIPYATVIAVLLLPYALFTFIGFVSGGKFSALFANSVDSSYMSILANEAGAVCNVNTILKLLLVLVVIALIYISRMSICVLLSYVLRKPVAVIFVGVILELLLSLIAVAAAGSEGLTKAISWTPFLMMRDNNLSTSVADLLKVGGTSIVFTCIILNITAGIFSKSEVK